MKNKKPPIYTIRHEPIKDWLPLLIIYVTVLMIAVVGIILVDIRLLGLLPVLLLPIVYYLYCRFYLSGCRILLDPLNKSVSVITPFSIKEFCFDDIYFTIKETGFRSASYIITIKTNSRKRIIRLRDDHWSNIQFITFLPHDTDSVMKHFKSKWK